jgi:hypothetical protein
MNATLKQSFYIIPKDNQLFSCTKFSVNKINVKQILKLYQNRCLFIPPNNILKSRNFRVLQKEYDQGHQEASWASGASADHSGTASMKACMCSAITC